MKKIAALLLVLLLLPGLINTRAASTPMPIIVKEYINATIVTDGSGYYCGPWNVTGYIIVMNNNTGETISDIWVPINTRAAGFTLSSSNVTYKPDYAYVTFGTPPTYVQNENSGVNNFMHITQLKSGDNVTVKYVRYYNNVCPPLLLNESMNPSKIVNGVNTTVNVTLTVKNNIGSDVYVKVRKILPQDSQSGDGWKDTTGNPKFTYSPGTTSPGKAGYSDNKKEFYWTGDGTWPDGWFTLPKDQTGKTSFNISGISDLSEVGGNTKKIPLGTVYLYFYMPHTYTGLKIGKVFAVGNADVEVKKEQGTSAPDTWNETLVFYDTSGVFKYDLFNTTIWATEGDTPDSTLIDPTHAHNTQQTFIIKQLSPGENYMYGPFNFTYSGVPKIWGLAKFRISNDQNNGWWNYTNATTITDSSGLSYFRVIEEIWAVNGYLVKARKEIRANATAGCYLIGISLSNIGQWMSPYVEMYDVVPSGFNPNPTSTEGNMVFKPLEMLAQDANSASPPDFSLKHISTEYTGYVWKSYPLPAPQLGFAEYFKGTGSDNQKTVTVTLADGKTRQWTVYPVNENTIKVNDTLTYAEGDEFTAGGTTFKVVWVDDNLTSGGGYVVVSAKGYYENLKMNVYNPVFVKYAVCGTGNYNATNLFIVGVDPRNTLDALAVSVPEARMSYGTSNFEIVFVIAAIAASIIAVRKR